VRTRVRFLRARKRRIMRCGGGSRRMR
jgi:hypothetical protein